MPARDRGSSAKLRARVAELERQLSACAQREAEAQELQRATREILQAIAASAGDAQAVLGTVASWAMRISRAVDTLIFRLEGDLVRLVAHHGPLETPRSAAEPWPLAERRVVNESIRERRPVHVPEIGPAVPLRFPDTWQHGRFTTEGEEHRTWLGVPLLVGPEAIGGLLIRRAEVAPFTEHEIAVVETFAAEAAIAIENARLFQELEERNRALGHALERQTATADILGMIASTPGDPQAVLDAIAEHAARLCDTYSAGILRVDRDALVPLAHYGFGPIMAGAPAEGPVRNPENPNLGGRLPIEGSFSGRAVLDRKTLHIPDAAAASPEEFPIGVANQKRTGQRTTLVTPLLREGEPIGVFMVRRREVRPFTDDQISLLETFADQAVIAIENARLFQEVEEKGRELAVAEAENGRIARKRMRRGRTCSR